MRRNCAEIESLLAEKRRMVRDHYDQHFLLTFPHGYDLPALLQRFAELSFLDEFIDCASEEVKRKHDKPLKILGKDCTVYMNTLLEKALNRKTVAYAEKMPPRFSKRDGTCLPSKSK